MTSGTRRAQARHGEMPVLRLSEHAGILAALSAMRSERSEHPSRGGEHLPRQAGPSTGPSRLRAERGRTRASAFREAPQAHIEGIVEPDDRVRSRPDQVAYGPLVAVRDPAIPSNCRARPLAQQGQGCSAEVRPEIQRVELDVGHAEGSRNLACERGLPGPGSPEHEDPLAPCKCVQRIALLLLARSGTSQITTRAAW
jgi:hypothetical protein